MTLTKDSINNEKRQITVGCDITILLFPRLCKFLVRHGHSTVTNHRWDFYFSNEDITDPSRRSDLVERLVKTRTDMWTPVDHPIDHRPTIPY